MSDVATLNNVRSHTRRGTLALFFLTPVVISAVPRLTWLFLPLIALALSVPVLRRRGEWRQLFQPNTAFIAVLLVAIYIFLNATWAADQGAAFGAAALLLGLALFTLAASTAIAESDELQLRRAALAFTAGAFFGALFVLFELLTKGLITRAVMNAIPLLQPDSAKHVRFSNGEVTKIKFSVFNRNVAIVMFNLWPGLLVLRTIEDGTRRAVLTGLFLLAVAVPVIISKHDLSQVALIGSCPRLHLGMRHGGDWSSAPSQSFGARPLFSSCQSIFSPTRPTYTWRPGYRPRLGPELLSGNTHPNACSTTLGSASAPIRRLRSKRHAGSPSNRRVTSCRE